MKRITNTFIAIFTIVIPVYLVVYLPDHVDWFEDETKNMNAEQKIAHYTKIINDDPADEDAYLERGIAKCAIRKYKSAIEDFTKAIGLDPESDWAYFHRGEAFMGMLDKKKAHADIKRWP